MTRAKHPKKIGVTRRLPRVGRFDANAGSAILVPKPLTPQGMKFRVMVWERGSWLFSSHASNKAECRAIGRRLKAMGSKVKFESVPAVVATVEPDDGGARPARKAGARSLVRRADRLSSDSRRSSEKAIKLSRHMMITALERKFRAARKFNSKLRFSDEELVYLYNRLCQAPH